jgi:hypothetical protein
VIFLSSSWKKYYGIIQGGEISINLSRLVSGDFCVTLCVRVERGCFIIISWSSRHLTLCILNQYRHELYFEFLGGGGGSFSMACLSTNCIARVIPESIQSTFCLIVQIKRPTRYGLGGPGIDSRWERDFPPFSMPVLRSKRPLIQCVPCFFAGGKAAGT